MPGSREKSTGLRRGGNGGAALGQSERLCASFFGPLERARAFRMTSWSDTDLSFEGRNGIQRDSCEGHGFGRAANPQIRPRNVEGKC
jgi:hypothetical protein